MHRSSAFVLFAFLAAYAAWTRSEIGHWLEVTPRSPALVIYLVAAIFVWLKPADIRCYLGLVVGIVADVIWKSPEVPNHWLLQALVSLTGIVAVIGFLIRHQKLPDGSELLEALRPGLQIGIALFYFFTGFWKTNTGFLDPIHSCGIKSWDRLEAIFGFLPSGSTLGIGIIAFTLALEWIGPILLLYRPTRYYTALCFAFFHAILALDIAQNYQNFSWTMFPLLTLYLEPRDIEKAWDLQPGLHRILGSLKYAIPLYVCLTVILTWLYGNQIYVRLRWIPAIIGAWLFVAFLAYILLIQCRSFQKISWRSVSWIFVILVFINGISPWIGLKNRNSWQMYSNIRMESDMSNHLFLPRSLDVFGYQADTVEILATSDSKLSEEIVDKKYLLTWHDFRTRLSQLPEVSVSWRRNGIEYHSDRVADSPELVAPPWLERKLVWFRPIGPGVEQECVW